MAAEKSAAAQPATRAAAAAAQAQQQSGPDSGRAGAPASAPAALAHTSGAGGGSAAATPPGGGPGSRNGSSPRADEPADGFAFAHASGCPTPAPLGNPPRLRIGKPGLAAEAQQGAPRGSIAQQAAQGGMGARHSAPKSVAFSSPGGTSPLSPLPPTPGTPLEVRAASEALLTAVAVGQPGAAPSPAREPAAYLEALLARLAGLNRDGYFDNPVDEEEAPGYYSFTQHPLCFADMRERLRRRQYRTWGDLLSDFELICDNALAYNSKRSRVHRAAATLQHAGRTLLQREEPSAKIAIAALHPDGPKAAAADARREKFNPRTAGGPPLLRSASSPATPPTGLASVSLGDTATTPDASDDARGEEPMDADEEGYSSYSDMEPDPGPRYLGGSVKANGHSRYPLRNGRNGAHNGKNGAKGAVSAAAAAAAALPDIGAVLKSISQDLHLLLPPGATRLLWSEDKDGSSSDGLEKPDRQLRSAAPATGSAAQSAASHQDAATSGPSTSGGPSAASCGADTSDGGAHPEKAQRGRSHAGRQQRRPRTTAWKEARRGIEWRARWLQLRMKGLQHTRQRHEAALHELRVRTRSMDDAASSDQAASPAQAALKADSATKAAAAKTGSPDAAVPADAPAMAAKQRAAGGPAAPAAQEAAPAVPDLPVAMAAKQRAAANAEAAAAAAKSAGAGGGKGSAPAPPPPVKKPRRSRLPVPGVAPSELAAHPWFAAHAAAGQMPKLPAGSATDAPAAPGDDDVWYAGRCYALLDLIEKQRVITRRMAASMCQMPDAGQQQEAAAAARGRANGNSLSARSRGGARPGSARIRTTGPPAKPSKRRRDDMSEPGTPLLTTGIGAPKFVERQQAMEIPLPQVRRLTQAEMAARRAAVAAWRLRLKQQSQPAAQKQPAGSAPASKAAAAAGSSSDEESDDDVFLLRHRPLELEERQRFLSYTTGGNMKARAKGGPGHKPKPSGGTLRAAGGGRPDSAPARTATAPPAMTALADAKPSGSAAAAEADAAGRKGHGSTRRGSREAEKQRSRGRGANVSRSGSRSPLLQSADAAAAQLAAAAAASAPAGAAAAVGAGAGAATNGKDSGKTQLRKD